MDFMGVFAAFGPGSLVPRIMKGNEFWVSWDKCCL